MILKSQSEASNYIVISQPPGDWCGVEPPVPFPNTEVKRPSADDTEGESPCGKYVIARRLFCFFDVESSFEL